MVQRARGVSVTGHIQVTACVKQRRMMSGILGTMNKSRIPEPGLATMIKMIEDRAPAGFSAPSWLFELLIRVYQQGRYDEASSETFDMVTW